MKRVVSVLGLLISAGALVKGQYVGIGTNTPQTRLHVHGAGGVDWGIRITSTGANSPTVNFYAGTATPNAGHISFGDNTGWRFHITRASDGTNLVTVQDNGNVGIGTTTPAQRLHVAGTIRSDALAGAHPGPQTYSLLGANTDGDIRRVNPTHGYLYSYTVVCGGTVEGTVRSSISNGTLVIQTYNEGGGLHQTCITLFGIANALVNFLIVNDDTGNCGGTARVSGVRSFTVTNGGPQAVVNTDLGCNGSDMNNMVFFIHYNPL